MTAVYVLDTDHISLLQRGNERVLERLGEVPEDSVASSIVSYEEQLRGRLTIVRRSRTPEELVVAYQRLREMQEFFCVMRILDFGADVAEIYRELRRVHGTMGAMDLRIAATALSIEGTLVTRNANDFEPIDRLRLENWARP